MQLKTHYSDLMSAMTVQLEHNGREVHTYVTDKDMQEATNLKLFKQQVLQKLLYDWLVLYGEAWMVESHDEGTTPTFKMVENVIDGEVVDAEGTSIGDRRGATAAERVLDSPHGDRLAIQAPRDRGDDHPEASSAAE